MCRIILIFGGANLFLFLFFCFVLFFVFFEVVTFFIMFNKNFTHILVLFCFFLIGRGTLFETNYHYLPTSPEIINLLNKNSFFPKDETQLSDCQNPKIETGSIEGTILFSILT